MPSNPNPLRLRIIQGAISFRVLIGDLDITSLVRKIDASFDERDLGAQAYLTTGRLMRWRADPLRPATWTVTLNDVVAEREIEPPLTGLTFQRKVDFG